MFEKRGEYAYYKVNQKKDMENRNESHYKFLKGLRKNRIEYYLLEKRFDTLLNQDEEFFVCTEESVRHTS